MSIDNPEDFSISLATIPEAGEDGYALAIYLEKLDIDQEIDPHELFGRQEFIDSPRTRALSLKKVLEIFSLSIDPFIFDLSKDVIKKLIGLENITEEDRVILEEFQLCPYNSQERENFPMFFDGRCSKPYCDLCHSVMVMCYEGNDMRNLNKYYEAVRIEVLHQVNRIIEEDYTRVFEYHRRNPTNVQVLDDLIEICEFELREIGMICGEDNSQTTNSDIDDSDSTSSSYYHQIREESIQDENEENALEATDEDINVNR
jgi:hypothetical protein